MSGFLIVALILAIVIPLVIAHQKKTTRAWSQAARELGLRFRPGGFLEGRRLTGTVHGMRVVVDTFTRGSGKNSSTYTRYQASFPKSLGLGLNLKREGFFSGVSKFFGSQDIQTGDVRFDQSMMVQGTREHAVRTFLTPARRLRIQRFMTRDYENTIDDHAIKCVKRGVTANANSIVATVQTIVRLGWHLTADRDDDHQLQKAMQLQNDGAPEEALKVIEATVVRADKEVRDKDVRKDRDVRADWDRSAHEAFLSVPVEERLVQGELQYLAGNRESAYRAFQELHEADPEDAEVMQWLEMTQPSEHSEMVKQATADAVSDGGHLEIEPVPEPADDRTAPESSIADVSLKAFCDDLFGESTRSFEINRHFENAYQGRNVEWSGELQKVERNYSSFIFESSGGCKATFKIDERPSPFYGTHNVLAVVHLPESAAEKLKDLVGESLSFTGKLVKADGLMRNVYVDHGEVA